LQARTLGRFGWFETNISNLRGGLLEFARAVRYKVHAPPILPAAVAGLHGCIPQRATFAQPGGENGARDG
jgi:hypothetical protein